MNAVSHGDWRRESLNISVQQERGELQDTTLGRDAF